MRTKPAPEADQLPMGYRITGIKSDEWELERRGHRCNCLYCEVPRWVLCGTFTSFKDARVDAFILANDPLPGETR